MTYFEVHAPEPGSATRHRSLKTSSQIAQKQRELGGSGHTQRDHRVRWDNFPSYSYPRLVCCCPYVLPYNLHQENVVILPFSCSENSRVPAAAVLPMPIPPAVMGSKRPGRCERDAQALFPQVSETPPCIKQNEQ